MRNSARNLLSALAAALFAFQCAASAEALPLTSIGISYEAAEGESCVTRDDVAEKAPTVLGLGADVALASMRGENCYLMSLADGRLIRLCVIDAPPDIASRDISELGEIDRIDFLAYLKRHYAAREARWLPDMPDYAMTESVSEGHMSLGSLAISTLYMGNIYSFKLDAVGRELTDGDKAALISAATRSVRLGDASGTLPGMEHHLYVEDVYALSGKSATVAADNTDVRLSLNDVPELTGATQILLSGEADPAAKLRVKVNGEQSEAFAPDENGAYSYLARRLESGAENKIEITASVGDLSSTLSLGISVAKRQTPLAAAPVAGYSCEDSVTIEGLSVPDALVYVKRGGSVMEIPVGEDGHFSFVLNTKKADTSYGFTVVAERAGCKPTEVSGKIRRIDLQASQSIDNQALADDPARYEGVVISRVGVIEALLYESGTPKCLVTFDDGGGAILRCPGLYGLNKGREISFIGTACGVNGAVGGDARAYPEIELKALLQNGEQQDGV